jgi:hypothetical protein
MLQKFKEWVCKTFWHSFSDIDMIMFRIKCSQLNRHNFPHPEIQCRRCGRIFIVENDEQRDHIYGDLGGSDVKALSKEN